MRAVSFEITAAGHPVLPAAAKNVRNPSSCSRTILQDGRINDKGITFEPRHSRQPNAGLLDLGNVSPGETRNVNANGRGLQGASAELEPCAPCSRVFAR